MQVAAVQNLYREIPLIVPVELFQLQRVVPVTDLHGNGGLESAVLGCAGYHGFPFGAPCDPHPGLVALHRRDGGIRAFPGHILVAGVFRAEHSHRGGGFPHVHISGLALHGYAFHMLQNSDPDPGPAVGAVRGSRGDVSLALLHARDDALRRNRHDVRPGGAEFNRGVRRLRRFDGPAQLPGFSGVDIRRLVQGDPGYRLLHMHGGAGRYLAGFPAGADNLTAAHRHGRNAALAADRGDLLV